MLCLNRTCVYDNDENDDAADDDDGNGKEDELTGRANTLIHMRP